MNRAPAHLIRGLSLVDTTALVIGTVIGTGVFPKAAPAERLSHEACGLTSELVEGNEKPRLATLA